MAYRVNAGLGDMTLFGPSLSSPLDPSTPPEKANMAKYGSGEWTRVLIDATQSWEFEPRPEWGGRHYPAINKIAPELEPESPPAGRSTGSASRTSTTSGGSCPNVGFFLQTYAHVLRNDDRDAAEQAAAFLIGNGWDIADEGDS
jgi:hypothetical protein